MSVQFVDAEGNPVPAPPVYLDDANGNRVQLDCENGDLIARAISGPNEGKSVNLTFGKWA